MTMGSHAPDILSCSKEVLDAVGTSKVSDAKETTSLKGSAQEDTSEKTSWLRGSFILTNIWLGCGLLNFPEAVMQAGGVVPTVALLLMAFVLTEGGLVMMVHCSDLCQVNTYQGVVRAYTGKFGLFWCNIFIIISLFGICVTFLVIIGDQMDLVMLNVSGPTFCDQWYQTRYFTITAIAVVFILPFCFLKNISSFWFSSLLGMVTAGYLLGLIVYKYYYTQVDQETFDEVIIDTRDSSWYGVLDAVTVIMFSFDAHIPAVPLYASLETRTLTAMGYMLVICSVVSFTVYAGVGVYGFMTFGANVKSDILTSYTHIDVPIMLGMALMVIKCIITFPVAFFCVRLVMSEIVSPACDFLCGTPELLQRVILSITLFSLAVLLAVIVPNIGTVISLLGGLAAFFLFIFPGLCLMQAYLDASSLMDHAKRLLGAVFIVFGTFLFVASSLMNIYSYVGGEHMAVDVACYQSL